MYTVTLVDEEMNKETIKNTKRTEILPDITNSCRLCLSNDFIVRNIFDNNNDKIWTECDISSQIYQATTIKVNFK